MISCGTLKEIEKQDGFTHQVFDGNCPPGQWCDRCQDLYVYTGEFEEPNLNLDTLVIQITNGRYNWVRGISNCDSVWMLEELEPPVRDTLVVMNDTLHSNNYTTMRIKCGISVYQYKESKHNRGKSTNFNISKYNWLLKY